MLLLRCYLRQLPRWIDLEHVLPLLCWMHRLYRYQHVHLVLCWSLLERWSLSNLFVFRSHFRQLSCRIHLEHVFFLFGRL